MRYVKIKHSKWDMFMFRLSALNVRLTHRKVIKHHLKVIKFCLEEMEDIGIPITKEENETLKRLLDLYYETINSLERDIKMYKGRLMKEEKDDTKETHYTDNHRD